MNIAPSICVGRRRHYRVIASSSCREENWLILVDVRALSRNSAVIYPCQIVFRLRAHFSHISMGETMEKNMCQISQGDSRTAMPAGCVHIIYNNMWIHTSGYITLQRICVEFSNGTWALSDPIEIKLNPCKIFCSVFV